jgi:predicted oxidoreductase
MTWFDDQMDADAIVIGAGLAGLAATAELARAGRLARTAAPHKILDPKAGPLIAVRLNILTRKTLGGLQTDLSGRVLGSGARPA